MLPMTGRSPGVHVSHIIHDLCLQLKHYAESDDGPNMTRLQLGCALETAIVNRYAQQYPDRYLIPGEFERDGLFGTPDLVDTDSWAVEEIKLTWLSSRHDIESVKFWKYLVQLKAYCHHWESSLGRLHVCHVMGDYAENRDPDYRVYELRFTSRELRENWEMLLDHARTMERD